MWSSCHGTVDQLFALAGLLGSHGICPPSLPVPFELGKRPKTRSQRFLLGGTMEVWGTGAIVMSHLLPSAPV